MKPNNWDSMSLHERRDAAGKLLATVRGQYLIGQALAIASRCLHEADHPRREESNAQDMEMLGLLYEPWFTDELRNHPAIHPAPIPALALSDVRSGSLALAADTPRRADGCEFCSPIEGDPFTNRPRGEAWACPCCNTVYSGKETS